MTGLQDGRYLLHVRTEGRKTMQLIEPDRRDDEIDRLKERIKVLEARSNVQQFEKLAAEMRADLGISPLEARFLALLYVNAPNVVEHELIDAVLYGNRHVGNPDDPRGAVRVFASRLRGLDCVGTKGIRNKSMEGYWMEQDAALAIQARLASIGKE